MEELRQLEKRLAGAIGKKRLILTLAGLTATLTIGLGLILLLSSVAALFIVPVPVKLVLLVISLGLMLYGLYQYLFIPLQAEKDIIKAAVQIEQNHPDLKGRLVAALQFRHFDFSKTNFSQALVDLTGAQAMELTAGIDFNEIVSGYPLIRKARSGAVMAVLVIVIGFLVPGIFTNALDVYSQPTSLVAPPPGFALKVFPGNAERVKYTDIEIGGAVIGGGFPANAEIFYRFADGRWQSEKIGLAGGKHITVAAGDSLPFSVTLKQVRRSFDYYVVAGDSKSATYAVNVVERPRVTGLKVTIHYPEYSRLKPLALDEDNGSFAALVGSRALLEIEANRDIAEASLVKSDSSQINIDFKGPRGAINLPINENFGYHIVLRDAQGEVNPDPIEYTVTAVPDEYPVITVTYPGYDVNLDETMQIPFRLHISDDYGFSSLILKYQIVSGGAKGTERVAVINFADNIVTEGEVSFNWDLDGFNLLPTDFVLYHFELADNDRVSGPKVSKTRVFAARLPSIDEIVQQTEAEQEGRVSESEKVLKEQKETADRLKEIAQQMKASQKLDWQKQKEMENIVNRQQEAAKKLEDMAREMEQSLQKQENNNLLSEQILKKMMELQKLMAEVATPEMKKAMEELAEALKKMSKEEVEEALKKFQMTQEEMLKRLERTVELLKRMQVEQRMAALLKMAEEMLLEQNRVNVETEQSPLKEQFPRLAQREQQLQKQMDALKDGAQKLQENLKDSPFAESQPHHRFAEAIMENQAADDMRQMEGALSQDQKQAALNSGQTASSKLGSLVDELRKIQTALAENSGDEIAKAIRKSIDDANYVTHKQEDLYNRSQDDGLKTKSLSEMAAEQQLLKSSVSSLTQNIDELAKQSPFLAAEIRTYLEQSQKNMQGSCDNLGEYRGRLSVDQQREAIYNLNRAAVGLMDGLDQQKQCNKGGSCNKPGSKMESLCQNQNQINQQTKSTCPNPGNNPTPSQRETLRKLAGEQGAVRKSLEEMQKEFGDRREILGRLDNLAAEAKQIQDMLDEGKVGQDLSDRQLKIYSRMLDVQKSLNRRDYSSERQAVTGQDIFRASPGSLDADNTELAPSLQDRLNRNLQEGYPRQYEQQIKAYFKALSGFDADADKK